MNTLFLYLVITSQQTGAEHRNIVAEAVHPLICPVLAHAGNKEIEALSMSHHLRLECQVVEAQQGDSNASPSE